MDKEIETTLKRMQEIKMTPDEKSVVLNNLIAFMDEHPVQAPSPAPTKVTFLEPTPSPFFSRFAFAGASRMMALAMVVLIVAGSGISYAAAGALPGDFLYPTKVNFNEKIASVVKITPEAKIEYEEARVETRIKEAEILIDEGKFDDRRQAAVEAELNNHMTRVYARIDTLPADRKARAVRIANEVIAPRIAEHRARIQALNEPIPVPIDTTRPSDVTPTPVEPTETTDGTISPTPAPTPTPSDTSGAVTQAATEEINLAPIAERSMHQANLKLDELRAVRPPNDEVRARLRVRITSIETVIRDAQSEYTAHNYRESIALARRALFMTETTLQELADMKEQSDDTATQ